MSRIKGGNGWIHHFPNGGEVVVVVVVVVGVDVRHQPTKKLIISLTLNMSVHKQARRLSWSSKIKKRKKKQKIKKE